MTISNVLKEHGYEFSWEQVQVRYKTLTTAFKKIERSQQEVWKWSWNELEEIMGKKPSCDPVATCSTNISTNASSSDEQLSEAESSDNIEASSDKIEESCSQEEKENCQCRCHWFLEGICGRPKEEKKAERDEESYVWTEVDMMKMFIDVLKKLY